MAFLLVNSSGPVGEAGGSWNLMTSGDWVSYLCSTSWAWGWEVVNLSSYPSELLVSKLLFPHLSSASFLQGWWVNLFQDDFLMGLSTSCPSSSDSSVELLLEFSQEVGLLRVSGCREEGSACPSTCTGVVAAAPLQVRSCSSSSVPSIRCQWMDSMDS